MAIKNLKKVYYRLEDNINDIYDESLDYQEIKVSELTQNARKEKFEITYLNNTRELNPSTASGRSTGELSFSKALNNSLLIDHTGLIEAGMGDVVAGGAAVTITAYELSSLKTKLTVGAAHGFSSNDIVQIITPSGNLSFNTVGSADATSITLRYPLIDAEYSKLTTTTSTVKKASYITIGKPIQGKTFTFVVEYDNSIVEVYRGCGVSASFELSNDGFAQIKFDIKASKVENKADGATSLHSPATDITAETSATLIYYDFRYSYVRNTSGTDVKLFPQTLMLKVNNTLENNTLIGGLNNIEGFYTKPSVECEANFHYNSSNILLFSPEYEGDLNRNYFCSQPTFAFYAPYCNYVMANPSDTNVYDSINVYMEINSEDDKQPVVVFPQ